MAWIAWPLLAIAVLAATLLFFVRYGALRWAVSTQDLLYELETARRWTPTRRYDVRELDGLPAPVQRYFRAALKDGQPMVAAVTIEQSGSMDLSRSSTRWRPFTARQRVVIRRPGFVWDARIAVLPGIAVHVHDAYVAGVGILKPSVLGLYALADLRGGGDLARGELIRYFAEAAWYPTALLPSQGVQWQAVDDHSACATLLDGVLGVSMLVGFDHAGLIETSRFEARGAMAGDKIVQIPWEGRWSDYQERGGMLVPVTGEAAWLHPQARKPYWRGSVTSLTYEFSL